MKAKEFIKKFGWEASQYWINKFIEINEVEEKFINTEFRDDLKEYVNAWELVQIHGLDQSKTIVNNAPSDEHFYSWTLGKSGVRDKSVNVGELRKAINLVESVNANE